LYFRRFNKFACRLAVVLLSGFGKHAVKGLDPRMVEMTNKVDGFMGEHQPLNS